MCLARYTVPLDQGVGVDISLALEQKLQRKIGLNQGLATILAKTMRKLAPSLNSPVDFSIFQGEFNNKLRV
jgi:hypothetical protein